MTSAIPKPAILFVHGGYFFNTSFHPFKKQLQKAGFMTRCPQLPSCGDKAPAAEKAGQPRDIAVVHAAAQELKAAGHSIIILAHSYGGIVVCGAITKDLYTPVDGNGRRSGPGVVHLVFLSCWIPQPGNSLEDVIKKYSFQCEVKLATNEDGTVYGTNVAESFYNDIFEVDPGRARALAADNTTHNWIANTVAVHGSPWKMVPSTYVHCKRDLAIMLPLQKNMVRDVVETGGKMNVLELDTGHCPFFSKPEEVVGILEKIGQNE